MAILAHLIVQGIFDILMEGREYMKKKWMGLLAVLMLWIMSINVLASEQMFATDVATASSGNVLLGLKGKYIIQTQAALDRINAIRWEACQEGVLCPGTLQPLTETDYVPIRWSADLEYIAKIRAAESSVTINHVRTNGESCFALTSPNGVSSTGEVLAWNWTESVVYGINQWYEEKSDWVNQNANAVTGHYTSMINPRNLYVGIGTFCAEGTLYYNTTAGEFSRSSNLTESAGSGVQTGVQILEVNKNYLTGQYAISGSVSGTRGDASSLSLVTSVAFPDAGWYYRSHGLLVLDGVTWESSDNTVAAVTPDGILSLKKCGNAQISALINGSTVVSETAAVGHTSTTIPAKAATCTSAGLTAGTKCSVCGEILTQQETVEKKAHTWDAGVVTQEPTIAKTGTKHFTCSVCGAGRTKTIAKVKLKKGQIYTVGNLKYKIISAKTDGKGAVALAGVSGKKTALTNLNVTKTIKIDGIKFTVVSIASKALKGCTKLKSVTVGNSVTKISSGAFYGCKALKTVTIGNGVAAIGSEAFYGCKALKTVTIGSGVTKISSRAFMKCTGLTKITIKSKKLTTVGTDAVKSVYSKVKIKVPSSRVKTYKKLFTAKTGWKKTMKVSK